MYTVHQFEEHGFDAVGRRYAFMDYFNSQAPFGLNGVMTPRLITIINVGNVWCIFLLSSLRAERAGD